MSGLEKKLYQLIISRLEGGSISSLTYRQEVIDLVQKGIGGFILFGGQKDEVRCFLEDMQALAETPLFVASDIERGVGQQVEGATGFPSQMAVAAALKKGDPADVPILEETIRAVARESVDVGINMPLIPVLDVNRNPDNPIICTRAFSDNPESVAWYGALYVKILEQAGLISCAKHFPGHGDTAVDSHISLPVIHTSSGELKNVALLPFVEVIKKGCSSIMAGHLSIPVIDDLPASLSKKVINDLLRRELNFQGLILTDALNMHALNEYGHIPSKCMNAGVDILLHPADPGETVQELTHALARGDIKEETIDQALVRILKIKERIRAISGLAADYERNAQLSSLISDRSVTLVRCREDLLPLKQRARVRLITAADENRHDPSVIRNLTPASSRLQDFQEQATGNTLIFALFTSVAAWQGTSGIGEEAVKKIGKMIRKASSSMVISFGSPYVLRHFSEADVLIAAYDTSQQAQVSVLKCLRGELDFRGMLPVTS